MKPFKSVTMLRTLMDEELQLEDPDWCGDEVVFFIPCCFQIDTVFAGLHVETDADGDYIDIYCRYNARTQNIRLFFVYINNSGEETGDPWFEVEVIMDPTTLATLQNKISDWLKTEDGSKFRKQVVTMP